MLYIDANATTPCAPEVVEAMRPFWEQNFANASSPHRAGRIAAQAVSQARRSVAESIDAMSHEVVFTSGATESTNLVFWGLLLAPRTRTKIVISAIEHKAVLDSAALLGEQGFEVVQLPVTADGIVDLNALEHAIDEHTALVSVQAVNNEIGTIQPTGMIAQLAHASGAFFHVDAVQALGKIPVSMQDWDCDFASFSAHKIYGPKGIGALYLRGGPQRWPWPRPLRGGGQEGGLRPGTLNVPGIVGFGAACTRFARQPQQTLDSIASLRSLLEKKLKNLFPGKIVILGEAAPRVPNTSGILFEGLDSDIFLLRSQELMCSQGAACSTGTVSISNTIKNVFPNYSNFGFLRFSLLENFCLNDIDKICLALQTEFQEYQQTN